MSQALEPARLSFDANGIPRAERYDDVYHSADGGLAQARHVFLAGNDLPRRWQGRHSFTILETGFGLGLNFLATADAWHSDASRCERLHYVSVEKHPLSRDDLAKAHAAWPELAPYAHELRAQWPLSIGGFHRLAFAAERIALTLLFGDALAMLGELDARADAVFLDGFSPEKNPEMWSDALIAEIARLSAPGATLATWTVAGRVRASLGNSGFRVDKRPGFGSKRDMSAGVRDTGAIGTSPRRPDDRRATIIGAGLAGVWCADALVRRGWQVEVIERHRRPAQEASSNAVGVVRPALNLADNDNARLARAAFLFARRRFDIDRRLARLFGGCGVLHVATSAAQADRMARIIETHGFPVDYVRWTAQAEAQHLAGRSVAGPGWWIPLGGYAYPPAVCEALLDPVNDRIATHFSTAIARVVATPNGWLLESTCGAVITETPVVILANAHDAGGFFAGAVPTLIKVRGQVSHLPPRAGRSIGVVVCGDGYVAPLPGGGHCVGATFDPNEATLAMRASDHAVNLARVERMLPGFATGLSASMLDGRVGIRTATADRIPACGRLVLQDDDGRRTPPYLLAGLGARGLIWAPFCAEALASELDGEPVPVERSLWRAMRATR
jgi:tRNA 5-methylaminomethyl-2-thiouridine biosynthesis bifunctional protein